MKKFYMIIAVVAVLIVSCSKNDEAPDLSYLCSNGGIWLVDKKDSFNPVQELDTFMFNQAGGFHRFIFTNSAVNRLQIDVLTKPDSGQTTIYKSVFIREISGSYIADAFNLAKNQDSILTIENKGSHYLISLKPSTAMIGSTRQIELRACQLRMNDVTP